MWYKVNVVNAWSFFDVENVDVDCRLAIMIVF